MELIEQPWEKKNLGVNSLEIKFDYKDDTKKIDFSILNNKKYNYLLSRVPSGKMDIANILQHNGFTFAEVSFELSADLKKLDLPNKYSRYINMMDYHLANDSELFKIHNLIRSGIFDTDRISLDPFFNAKQSGNRFANWSEHEIVSGSAKGYIVTAGNDEIGFFVHKRMSDKLDYSLLAALYNKENSAGMGFSVLYFPMLQSKKEGKSKIIASVSSNNFSSLKLHLELGYKIKTMNYVFVKHIL